MGFPIQKSPDQRIFAPPRSLSQLITSFIGIEQYGPYKLHGDPEMMRRMDDLLQGFVAQHRMKLPGGTAYIPCYEIIA